MFKSCATTELQSENRRRKQGCLITTSFRPCWTRCIPTPIRTRRPKSEGHSNIRRARSAEQGQSSENRSTLHPSGEDTPECLGQDRGSFSAGIIQFPILDDNNGALPGQEVQLHTSPGGSPPGRGRESATAMARRAAMKAMSVKQHPMCFCRRNRVNTRCNQCSVPICPMCAGNHRKRSDRSKCAHQEHLVVIESIQEIVDREVQSEDSRAWRVPASRVCPASEASSHDLLPLHVEPKASPEQHKKQSLRGGIFASPYFGFRASLSPERQSVQPAQPLAGLHTSPRRRQHRPMRPPGSSVRSKFSKERFFAELTHATSAQLHIAQIIQRKSTLLKIRAFCKDHQIRQQGRVSDIAIRIAMEAPRSAIRQLLE